MEITLEAIIGIISLLIGGTGVGGFLFWRQHKRKEEAEAKLAEAEAKLKEAEVEKLKLRPKKKIKTTISSWRRTSWKIVKTASGRTTNCDQSATTTRTSAMNYATHFQN